MRRITLPAMMFCLFGFSYTYSQTSDFGAWYNYYGNNRVSKHLNWWNEVQYRNYNMGGDLEQLLLRTGLGYNLSENNNNLLLGYGFVYSAPYDAGGSKTAIREHRLFQQFITKQQFGRFFIQHRYRVEERFLASGFKIRFRYLLGLNIPLNKKNMIKHAVYLSLYDEMFLNAVSPVFDRNRLYGALGFVFNKNLRLELGVMSQMQETRTREQLQLCFFNSLPFYK